MLKKGYMTTFVAVIMLFGHFGLFPMIYAYARRLIAQEQNDLAMLIGPITAASVITVVKFVIDRQDQRISDTADVNFLFALFAGKIPLIALGANYFLIFLVQNGNISDPAQAKAFIGVIEIFIGGSFALIIGSLFETDKVKKK